MSGPTPLRLRQGHQWTGSSAPPVYDPNHFLAATVAARGGTSPYGFVDPRSMPVAFTTIFPKEPADMTEGEKEHVFNTVYGKSDFVKKIMDPAGEIEVNKMIVRNSRQRLLLAAQVEAGGIHGTNAVATFTRLVSHSERITSASTVMYDYAVEEVAKLREERAKLDRKIASAETKKSIFFETGTAMDELTDLANESLQKCDTRMMSDDELTQGTTRRMEIGTNGAGNDDARISE